MTRWLTAALVLLPSLAFAQESVQLSDYQIKANDSGVKALIAQDFEGAVANFQSSLRLGEANITLLNLGRTYQKMGRCMDAKNAYTQARTAPVVSSPSPQEITSIVDTYYAELPQACPSKVTIECETGVLNPVLNGTACACGETVEVAPGPLALSAEHAEEILLADLAEGEVRVVSLKHVEPTPVAEAPKALEPAPSGGFTGLQTTGLVVGGLGAATVVTALILDNTWVKDAVDASNEGRTQTLFDEAESRQTLNKVLLFSGAALVVGGGVLYLLSPDETQTAVWVAPRINGAVLGGTF